MIFTKIAIKKTIREPIAISILLTVFGKVILYIKNKVMNTVHKTQLDI
jgi:hypothetical protein